MYLVANINGGPSDKDGNGFISRISPEGEVIALKWIDGAAESVTPFTLNAPKGMALTGDRLFVADIDVVRVFDRERGDWLDEVCFRLYANAIGGTVIASALKVDGQDVGPIYEGLNSVLRVPLPHTLRPGEQIVIQIDFEVEPPHHLDSNYGTFSYADGVLALDVWYPVVAVYDDEGWNVDVRSSGDLTYLDASFYLVRVVAPADLTIITSGSRVGHEREEERQIATFAAGPSRDFYLVAGDRYTVVSATVGETTINSYAFAEYVNGAELALEFARGIFESFNERLGAYPYTEFDIVSTPMQAVGVEYASVVVLAFDVYDLDSKMPGTPLVLLESVIAHEAAHQSLGVCGSG